MPTQSLLKACAIYCGQGFINVIGSLHNSRVYRNVTASCYMALYNLGAHDLHGWRLTVLHWQTWELPRWRYGIFTLRGSWLGQVQGTGQELIGSNILYISIHTGLRVGNEPDPLSSIMPVPVPVPVPVPCSVNEPLRLCFDSWQGKDFCFSCLRIDLVVKDKLKENAVLVVNLCP